MADSSIEHASSISRDMRAPAPTLCQFPVFRARHFPRAPGPHAGYLKETSDKNELGPLVEPAM